MIRARKERNWVLWWEITDGEKWVDSGLSLEAGLADLLTRVAVKGHGRELKGRTPGWKARLRAWAEEGRTSNRAKE